MPTLAEMIQQLNEKGFLLRSLSQDEKRPCRGEVDPVFRATISTFYQAFPHRFLEGYGLTLEDALADAMRWIDTPLRATPLPPPVMAEASVPRTRLRAGPTLSLADLGL